MSINSWIVRVLREATRSSYVNTENDTGRASRSGGGNISATPSIALLNRRLGISPAPRMLTRSGISLLRQGVREIAQVTHEVLASRSDTSQT